MPRKFIDEIEYELTSTFHENGSSTHALETIVEEGETAVKKYRCDLDVYNPETQRTFVSQDVTIDYLLSGPRSLWGDWFELSEPEEESE